MECGSPIWLEGNPWYEIAWSSDHDVQVVTEVTASFLDGYEPDF